MRSPGDVMGEVGVNVRRSALGVERSEVSMPTTRPVSSNLRKTLSIVLVGEPLAEMSEQATTAMEYEWHRDAGWDPFAKVWGLV